MAAVEAAKAEQEPGALMNHCGQAAIVLPANRPNIWMQRFHLPHQRSDARKPGGVHIWNPGALPLPAFCIPACAGMTSTHAVRDDANPAGPSVRLCCLPDR